MRIDSMTIALGAASPLPPVRPVPAVRREPLPGVAEFKSPAVDRFERSLKTPAEQVTYGPPCVGPGCEPEG